jgi:hypothetical protein
MANLRANRITSTEVFETTGSVQFDGSGDYLSVANSILAFGTDDFTIEFWVYRKKSNYNGYWEQNTVLTTGHLSIYDNADGKITVRIGSSIAIQEDNPQPLNTWGHYAITRKSGIAYFYYNGVLNFSGSATGEITPTSARIGALNYNSPAHDFNGHISNFRILKGQALYTENFTPPTRELEVIPNTVLLACQSTTKADEEKTGKTITVNGNAVANELTPGLLTNVVKSGGSSAITGSVEFDGTGDYLQITEENDFDLGADDFTIEYWYNEGNDDRTERRTLYMQDSAQQWIVGHTNDNSGRIFFQAYDSSGNTISGSAVVSADASNPTGKRNYWRHLAVVRNGTTATIYLDGVTSGSRSFGTTAIRGDQNDLYIGKDPNTTLRDFRGFISNLRIVKGTALYTGDFIPPTRKLTKLPGTVLLCCQDSNDPTTEATGKTITGYGDLQKADGVELVTNGTFDTDSDWTKGTGWTISGGVATGSNTNGSCSQQLAVIAGKTYYLKYTVSGYTGGSVQVQIGNSGGYTITANGNYTDIIVAPSDNVFLELDGISSFSGSFDNVSVTLYDPPNRASDFTPSVGSDDSVEFAGPTTINTENYFYLPTGPTEQRARGRGLFGGGDPGINTINYITIASMGNAQDFGDLSQTRLGPGSVASSTRAVFMTGYRFGDGNVDTMDFVTIATTGNAVDFGNLEDDDRHETAGVSNQTRGMVGGGQGSAILDRIDCITIASTGDSIDFGNLTLARRNATGVMSPTRGVFCGGRDNTPAPSTQQEEMDYVTIASTGNALNFGDLTVARGRMGSVCSSVRGVVGGGEGSPADSNVIDYITIASTGNAQDFGDMITASEGDNGGCSNSMRGVFGGHDVPAGRNIMEYVNISSTGNSQDFGDLTNSSTRRTGCSDSHGGLG